MKALDITMGALGGALYGVLGYYTYLLLPITAPGIGIVRFWPPVVIPAVLAVLFGPLPGAIGGAIGIFISDVLIHGDPLLSLTAGVSSNFIGFYLIGYLSRRNMDWVKIVIVTGIALLISCVVSGYVLLIYVSINAAELFIGLLIASFSIVIAMGYYWPEWRSYGIASVIGLGVASIIIGFAVWGYSQIFILPQPVGGGFQLPLYTAFIWFIWTFATEIPFLVILGPPILKSCFKALPSIGPVRSEK